MSHKVPHKLASLDVIDLLSTAFFVPFQLILFFCCY